MNCETNIQDSIQSASPNTVIASEIESELSELFNMLCDDRINSETLRNRIDKLMTKRELLKKYEIKQGKGKDKRYYVRINNKSMFFHKN